jgi:hypothetical protein
MKSKFKIIAFLLLIISCAPSRYYLLDENDNKKYLSERIKELKRENLISNKPNISVPGVNYYTYKDLKTKQIELYSNEIDTVKVGPIKLPKQQSTIEIITHKQRKVIDGKAHKDEIAVLYDSVLISEAELTRIPPDDIARLDIIRNDSIQKLFGYYDYDGLIFVTSKNFVRTQYRKKLSSISTEYRNFINYIPLESEHDNIVYYINDIMIDSKVPENEIDELDTDEIKEIRIINTEFGLKLFNIEDKQGIVQIITF